MMKRWTHIPLLVAGLLLGIFRGASGQQVQVYLFPGQGSDERLFKHLRLPEGYDTTHVSYPVPDKGEDLKHYAMRFASLIDTAQPFVLLGVSLGGMICTELADTLDPEAVVLVSSAKTQHELPGRYTFMRRVPLDKIIPRGVVKASGRILQGIVEPDRKHDKETFKSMLREKDARYLKRTAQMIARWDRTIHSEKIVHIHGNNDHTIPVKNLEADYIVEGGSHMMMVTRAEEINAILEKILLNHEP